MTKQWRMRLVVVGVVTALAVALGVSVAIVVADPPPSPSQPPPPRAGDFKPAPPPGLGPRPATLEEERKLKEEIQRQTRGDAPSTPAFGGKIVVLGRTITLPPDAYIYGIVDELLGPCASSPCQKPLIYELRRGKSVFWVFSDGIIDDRLVAQGEEHLFDFVREALNEESIDRVQSTN